MEELKKLLGEELFKQVTEKIGDQGLFLHKKDEKVIIDDGSLVKKEGMIPKDRFDEVNDKKKEFESKVSDLMNQVDDLKKSSGNKGELEKKIKGLEDSYKNLQEESKKSSENTSKRFALRDALREAEAKPNYVDMLETRFNLDQLVIGEDGKIKSVKKSDTEIVAFADVIKETKEAYPDSFGEVVRSGKKPGKGGDPGTEFYSKEEIDALSDEDMVKNIDKVNKSLEYVSKQTE